MNGQIISGTTNVQGGKKYTYLYNNYQGGGQFGESFPVSISNGSGPSIVYLGPYMVSSSFSVTWDNVSARGRIAVGSTALSVDITKQCYTTDISQNITSNKNYSDCIINVHNTNISNNAVVNITAEERVRITPGFRAHQGTKVTIKATGNGALRSSSMIDEEDTVLPEENVFETRNTTSINDVKEISQIVCINVYSIAGLQIYSSTTDFDIKSANLNQGIYIVETINNSGEIKREKVLIGR